MSPVSFLFVFLQLNAPVANSSCLYAEFFLISLFFWRLYYFFLFLAGHTQQWSGIIYGFALRNHSLQSVLRGTYGVLRLNLNLLHARQTFYPPYYFSGPKVCIQQEWAYYVKLVETLGVVHQINLSKVDDNKKPWEFVIVYETDSETTL